MNFYEGVTQAEVETYYKGIVDEKDATPISYGLNSRVVKKDGKVVEEVASIDGLYGPAIAKIVYWLEKAAGVAENERQKKVIEALIAYYRTGDLEKFDAYNILWVEDLASMVDFVNGFIEVYNDPLGMKASWESLVNFKDLAATKRADTLSANAQWFEDNSPVDPRFKKKEVKGVSAKVITAAMLGGDCYPSTPIGINLPNANWIRKNHGSKSVTLENITYAYDQSSLKSGFGKEFSWSEEILERSKKYGPLAGNIHTDMHEVLGHGSGQLLPGVGPESLKNYHSPIEESRADLFALYYIMDPKMIELGLLPAPGRGQGGIRRQHPQRPDDPAHPDRARQDDRAGPHAQPGHGLPLGLREGQGRERHLPGDEGREDLLRHQRLPRSCAGSTASSSPRSSASRAKGTTRPPGTSSRPTASRSTRPCIRRSSSATPS